MPAWRSEHMYCKENTSLPINVNFKNPQLTVDTVYLYAYPAVNPGHKIYINQYNHIENQSNVCPASSRNIK